MPLLYEGIGTVGVEESFQAQGLLTAGAWNLFEPRSDGLHAI